MLRQSRRLERTVLLAFDAAALEAVRKAEPRLRTGLLVDRTLGAVKRAKQIGAEQLAPRHTRATKRLTGRAHQVGLPVVAWTVNSRDEMRRLVSAGVDGIMTNYPDRLGELLGQMRRK
jgi:glycerophosphoryl diester phosphodiesterase